MLTLSKRLERVAEYVIKYAKKPTNLADIGSDHAYLPIYLVQNKIAEKAVAGEIVKGPYEASVKNVSSNNLADKINVRLASGLDAIEAEDEINTITICGMGGTLISEILEAGLSKIKPGTLLVLQANIAGERVRGWFNENNVKVIDESVMEDGKHFYEFIVGCYEPELDQSKLDDAQQLFGPINLKNPSADFIKLWERELNNSQKIITQIEKGQTTPENKERLDKLRHKVDLIKEVIK